MKFNFSQAARNNKNAYLPDRDFLLNTTYLISKWSFLPFDNYFNEVNSVRERWTDNGLVNLVDFDLM